MATSSIFFMTKPPFDVQQAMLQTLIGKGWDRQLGDTLSDPENWHQSLSPPLASTPALCDSLMAIGSRIDALSFTIVLNHVRGARGPNRGIHWEFTARDASNPFTALVETIRNGLLRIGQDGTTGRRRHVTVSYWAPHALASTEILPIAWRIDSLLLVESRGTGTDYHYHTLGQWPLRAAPPGVESQRALW